LADGRQTLGLDEAALESFGPPARPFEFLPQRFRFGGLQGFFLGSRRK
jgi:hypothetical protein